MIQDIVILLCKKCHAEIQRMPKHRLQQNIIEEQDFGRLLQMQAPLDCLVVEDKKIILKHKKRASVHKKILCPLCKTSVGIVIISGTHSHLSLLQTPFLNLELIEFDFERVDRREELQKIFFEDQQYIESLKKLAAKLDSISKGSDITQGLLEQLQNNYFILQNL